MKDRRPYYDLTIIILITNGGGFRGAFSFKSDASLPFNLKSRENVAVVHVDGFHHSADGSIILCGVSGNN